MAAEVDRKELTVEIKTGEGPAPPPTTMPIAGLDELLAVMPLLMLGGMTAQMTRTMARKGK